MKITQPNFVHLFSRQRSIKVLFFSKLLYVYEILTSQNFKFEF